jgi:hypothetical protein
MKLSALKGGASRRGSFFCIVALDRVLKDWACGPHAGHSDVEVTYICNILKVNGNIFLVHIVKRFTFLLKFTL